MPGRLLYRTVTLVLFASFLFATGASAVVTSSAQRFLSEKKALGAASPDLTFMKSNPAAYVGKVVELSGRVGGMMKSGDTTSFLLDCNGESLVIKAGKEVADCIANGNTIRALVRVGAGCTTSPSDLVLETSAYDYDVCRFEQEMILKASGKASPVTPDRGSKAASSSSARSARGVHLSSRAQQIYDPYRKFIARLNPKLPDDQLDTITSSILAYSEHYGIDPRLVVALIIAESNFKPNATSRAGAMGLGQLMPGTARGLGVNNAYDPQQNIEASVRLMRGHMDKYGDLSLVLSAYNAGPGAVRKYNGVPPYRETRNYIKKIASIYNALCGK